jgi:hypothetical protein
VLGAADVDPVAARVMHAVQQPLAMSAFGGGRELGRLARLRPGKCVICGRRAGISVASGNEHTTGG